MKKIWLATGLGALLVSLCACGAIGGTSGKDAGETSVAQKYVVTAPSSPETPPYPTEEEWEAYGNGKDVAGFEKKMDAWQSAEYARQDIGETTWGPYRNFFAATTASLVGDGTENRAFSPLSIYLALGMLAETTAGNTQQEVLNALHTPSAEAVQTVSRDLLGRNTVDDGQHIVSIGNGMWLNNSKAIKYHQETLDLLKNHFGAALYQGNPGDEAYSAAFRDWINEKTRGLLKEAASELKFDADMVATLASTVYFKSAWRDAFAKEETKPQTFHAASGDAEADFMHARSNLLYAETPDYQAVYLPYKQDGGMWLLLPREGKNPAEVLSSADALSLVTSARAEGANGEDAAAGGYDDGAGNEASAAEASSTEAGTSAAPGDGGETVTGEELLSRSVDLALPKFDVSFDLDLKAALASWGIRDALDSSRADFSALTDTPVYLSTALHAARVKIDEEGTEAAAFTVLMMEAAMEAPQEPLPLVFDRPFAFVIDNEDHQPLFAGVVAEM